MSIMQAHNQLLELLKQWGWTVTTFPSGGLKLTDATGWWTTDVLGATARQIHRERAQAITDGKVDPTRRHPLQDV